ncbi:MAG: DUF2061 domain-containing protein [Candidatus Odinarchaeota archaeon]
MKFKKIEWKQSLLKSLIYRALALALGTLTVFLITGSIAIATGAAVLTELVQGVNYFIYEITWSNVSRRKLEKKIIERIKRREINLKLDFSSIKELAYQLSQIDTFVPKLYIQTKGIFDSMLENEELEEIHEDIKKFKDYFEAVHSERKLFFPKVKEQ